MSKIVILIKIRYANTFVSDNLMSVGAAVKYWNRLDHSIPVCCG